MASVGRFETSRKKAIINRVATNSSNAHGHISRIDFHQIKQMSRIPIHLVVSIARMSKYQSKNVQIPKEMSISILKFHISISMSMIF